MTALFQDPQDQQALRELVVQVCRLLYDKNLIPASDGNVSVRWGNEYVIITPAGVFKGLLQPQDLVITDLQGNPASEDIAPSNGLRPSGELHTHLTAYRQRADVRAVVHAHAPITTALTVAGISMAPCVLPETLVTVGTIATTAYANPTSEQMSAIISDLVREHDALVLDRHGALTVGSSLLKAYALMEKVEHTAQILLYAHLRGKVQLLAPEDIRHLSALRDTMLGPGRHFYGPDCAICGACEGLDDD